MQQVNLYKLLDHKQKIACAALHIVYACAAMLAVTLLFAVVVTVQNMWLTSDIASANAQAELYSNESAAGQNKMLNQLAQETAALQKKLVHQQAILKALEKSKRDGKQIFSSQLAGLGNQHIKGLWLNHIEFNGGGAWVSLKGVTKSAAALPRYLQALGQEQAFSGLRFDLMKIKSATDSNTNGLLNFEVSVKPDIGEDKS